MACAEAIGDLNGGGRAGRREGAPGCSSSLDRVEPLLQQFDQPCPLPAQDPRENEEAVPSDVEDEPSRVAGSEAEDGEGEDLMDGMEA